MKNWLVQLGRSNTLRLVAASAALLSGGDDLVELYFGVKDMFGLDAAHGVAFMALTGILEPLAKLISEGREPLIKLAEKE